MSVSVSELPPKYQAQALRKWREQQAKTEPIVSQGSKTKQDSKAKYHNKPTERITPTGAIIHFDSQKEANRYDHLILLEQGGQIQNLRLQVDFTLQEAYTDTEGRRVRAIRYKADFTYREQERLVVEDVKSKATKTKEYIMKRKLLKERFGIDITEV